MRRFLVVGCGGSGGKTLAYLMDQLRSDLSKDGIADLPAGWQFVFVDVPSAVDEGPEGLGSVVDQGGTYLGMGPRGGSYPDLDHAVSQQLRSNGGLGSIATWAPRDPGRVQRPIDVGAGQYRALGRMILLARAGEVKRALQEAYGRLFVRDTHAQMAAAAAATDGTYDQNLPPLIFVVGSMAGGSGASMALDVCRLLTQVPGVNPALIALYMVSADIFDSLHRSERSGVRANSLAMLGEIVANQTGAARRHDAAILASLGLRDGEGTAIPFARVFPVGRTMGAEKALFGDGSMKSVYRGLARGLAGLMLSEVASQQFVDFDLGNAAATPPHLGYLGWGSMAEPIPWGSYGFASLSMGRDRYAEYAAQRIARTAVDQLLDGHLQPGSTASPLDQIQVLLDSQWAGICARLKIPAGGAGALDSEVGTWMMSTAFPRDEAITAAQQIVERDLVPFLPSSHQQQAGQWRDALSHAVRQRRQPITEGIQTAAYGWAFGWHQGLLDRLRTEITDAISSLGLAYAGALVERLRAHLSDVLAPGAQILGRAPAADVSEVPAEVLTTLAVMKGTISGGEVIVTKVVDGVQRRAVTNLYQRSSALAGDSVLAFVTDVLPPLLAAIKESQLLLEQARSSQLRHDGLARLETDQYVAWPSDDDQQVPQRFDEANNEVLLTSSRAYAVQYDADLAHALPASSGAGGRAAVAADVISGVWPTVQGAVPPGGLLQVTTGWSAKIFSRDPNSGQAVIPSEARFVVHARPRDLVARARQFVSRTDGSFDAFCRVSLRDYLADPQVPESQRSGRLRDLVGKFGEALGMALPLISADERSVQALHNESVQYRYKFSAVPFRSLSVVEDLRQILVDNRNIDSTSLDNFAAALTDQGNPRRIDIFGSYPLYSPLVFDSVLEPVSAEWDGLAPQGRTAYWTNRRTRPLDASLAMSDAERHAMVAGWFIAQLVGGLQIPDAPYATPVRIWDAAEGRWLDFPYPLLTMPDRFTVSYDWLPAVLESHLLAVAHAQQAPVMSSLGPYRVLRGMYDDTELGPAGGIHEVSATAKLRGWLRNGSTSGAPSRIGSVAAAATPDERAAAAIAWLTGPGGPGDVARAYLPAASAGGVDGSYATVTSREQASRTPMFRDVAPDVAWATKRVAELIEQAAADPGTPDEGRGPDDAPPPGGVF